MFAKKLNIIDKNSESKIVEGIVFNSLYRFINREKQLSEPKIKMGFYSGKKEVDFVIDEFGFEVKWQNNVSYKDFPNINIKKKILLSKSTLKLDNKTEEAIIIPAPLLLAAL